MNRGSSLAVRMLLVLILGSVAAAYGEGVELDPTFGTGGIATFAPGTLHDNARGAVALEDNTILFCGTATLGGLTSAFLMHVLEDGTQDMTFAGDGLAEMQFGTSTYGYDLIRLADGKLLVAGIAYLTTTDSEMFVARFNADGTVDASFGTGGYTTTTYSVEEEYEAAMAVQPNGAILLGGRTYAGNFSSLLFTRFTQDGILDTAFGDGGYTVIDASTQDECIHDLDFLSDGTIVGIGYGYHSTPYYGERVCMAKLDTFGIPVEGFGTGGVYTPPIFDDISKANAVLIQNDSLYVTGYIYDEVNDWKLFLAKLDDAGNADPNFGDAGISTFKQSANDHINLGYDLLIPPADGKIYICGTSGYGPMMYPRDFILLRYQTDGQLDPSFNGTGYIVTSLGPDFEEANALVLQPDGKIVLAGFGKLGANNDAALVRYLVDDLMGSSGFSSTSLDPVALRASPNPFSISTRLTFTLASSGRVKLEVFDLAGRQVATVPGDFLAAGTHTVPFAGEHLSEGVYFCRLRGKIGTIATETITLMR